MPDKNSKYLRKMDLSQGDDSKISGGQFIAETLKGYGVTHVFFYGYRFEKRICGDGGLRDPSYFSSL